MLLRTGGGKSLLWQLPVKAERDGGLTVVVVPTKALELDLHESTERVLAGTGLLSVVDEPRTVYAFSSRWRAAKWCLHAFNQAAPILSPPPWPSEYLHDQWR